MTAPSDTAAPARTIRLIHVAMIAAVLLFALVGHFVLRPTMANSGDSSALVLFVPLGLSLGACAMSLVLRKRVPQRSTDESDDLFWTSATVPALLTWASLEAASLFAILGYALTGSPLAIAVAAVAVILLAVQNPARLERR